MRIQELDFSVDLLRSLLWQYNEAANLEALVRAKQTWYDAGQTAFWNDWYVDVFDLRTANDFGLAVWAIILGLPLSVKPADDPDKPIFGFGADAFGPGTNDRVNFNNGNFAASGQIILTTEQKRLALRLRYFQLTTRGSVPHINFILNAVFGAGAAYVVDSLTMRMRYVFTAPIGSQLEFVLTEYDLLPRPAGVLVDYVIMGDADGFGFGVYHENFNNGNFYHG